MSVEYPFQRCPKAYSRAPTQTNNICAMICIISKILTSIESDQAALTFYSRLNAADHKKSEALSVNPQN